MSEVPPNYYACSRSERDHLLAAAQLQGDDLPNGREIQRQVETLRENERPGPTATYGALDALVGYGWLDKTGADGRANAYELTTDGRRVLADAKTENPE